MWWVPLAAAAVDAVSSNIGANRQMDFQKEMASTQYQRSAQDLERAGLNRVLALGNQAAAPSGAMPAPTRFSEAAYQSITAKQALATGKAQEELLKAQRDQSEATAAKARTDSLVSLELLPFQKQQLGSQAAAAEQQAELTRVNALLADLEEDKQRVLKSLYSEFGPVVLDVVRQLAGTISSAKDAMGSFSGAVDKALQMFGNSAKGQEDRFASKQEVNAIAETFVRAVQEGTLPAEKVKDLSSEIQEAVYRINPAWRNLKPIK